LSKPTGHAICPFSGIKITPRTRHTHAERVSNESPTPRPGLSAFTTVGDALFRMREPTCCATHPCAAVKETPRTRHTHAEREATETSLLRCRQRELNIPKEPFSHYLVNSKPQSHQIRTPSSYHAWSRVQRTTFVELELELDPNLHKPTRNAKLANPVVAQNLGFELGGNTS
jgi:hypothetical protein